MFGILILYFIFSWSWEARLSSSLISDNQGNIFALLNQKTAFLMRLIVMLHKAGVQLAPSHMKRDYNQWADELTHPNFAGFRPDRQLPVSKAFFPNSSRNGGLSGPNSKRRKADPKATSGPMEPGGSRPFSRLMWWVVWALLLLLTPDAKAPGFDGRVEMWHRH